MAINIEQVSAIKLMPKNPHRKGKHLIAESIEPIKQKKVYLHHEIHDIDPKLRISCGIDNRDHIRRPNRHIQTIEKNC